MRVIVGAVRDEDVEAAVLGSRSPVLRCLWVYFVATTAHEDQGEDKDEDDADDDADDDAR